MAIRKSLGALLLACSSLVPVQAQERPGPLEDAERAFADALMRHDRSAFVALFAPDAESLLPVVKHGPEAIANSWLPFLIDPGTTMLLTSTTVTTAPAGDAGNSTGTLAVRGRTNTGVQTLPLGSYSIAWRVVDGRWKISTLSGTFESKRQTADRGGVGGFRFGMTRIEVSQVADCHPYTNVSVTGGLECPHYQFEGREMNISFLFAGDRLRRIQLWIYEGTSEPDTREAVARVLAYLERKAGGITIVALPDRTPTPEAVMTLLNSTPLQPGSIAQVVISTQPSASERWFSRIGRHQNGYMVMLFAEPHDGH